MEIETFLTDYLSEKLDIESAGADRIRLGDGADHAAGTLGLHSQTTSYKHYLNEGRRILTKYFKRL